MRSLKTKVSTPEVEETRDFFASVFSMSVVEEWDSPGDKGVILQFHDGSREALLEIYHAEQRYDFSGLSLQFRVDDVEAFVESLPDDVASEGPVDRPWGSRYVYLTDPNGIGLIVYDGGW